MALENQVTFAEAGNPKRVTQLTENTDAAGAYFLTEKVGESAAKKTSYATVESAVKSKVQSEYLQTLSVTPASDKTMSEKLVVGELKKRDDKIVQLEHVQDTAFAPFYNFTQTKDVSSLVSDRGTGGQVFSTSNDMLIQHDCLVDSIKYKAELGSSCTFAVGRIIEGKLTIISTFKDTSNINGYRTIHPNFPCKIGDYVGIIGADSVFYIKLNESYDGNFIQYEIGGGLTVNRKGYMSVILTLLTIDVQKNIDVVDAKIDSTDSMLTNMLASYHTKIFDDQPSDIGSAGAYFNTSTDLEVFGDCAVTQIRYKAKAGVTCTFALGRIIDGKLTVVSTLKDTSNVDGYRIATCRIAAKKGDFLGIIDASSQFYIKFAWAYTSKFLQYNIGGGLFSENKGIMDVSYEYANYTSNPFGNNVLIVSKEGWYNTIQSAVDAAKSSAERKVTIMVCPGVYEESVMVGGDKFISIIGVNKNECILRMDTGAYEDAPLEIEGNSYIANMTFIHTHEKAAAGTDINTLRGYAVHVDYPGEGVCEFFNCRFESFQNAAVGCGLFKDQSLIFRNCELLSHTQENSPMLVNGSLFVHDGANATNQKLIVDSCRISSDRSYSAYINGHYRTEMTAAFYNNIFWSEELKKQDSSIHTDAPSASGYMSGRIKLTEDSFGNNVNKLNA